MGWKEILKQENVPADMQYVDKYDMRQYQIDHLIESALDKDRLEDFYKERLDSILTGEQRGIRNLNQQLSQFPDEEKHLFVYPVAAAVKREILKDEPLLDKLIRKFRHYFAFEFQSRNGFEGGLYNEWDEKGPQIFEGIKKDTMDFFEEHLTTQKYVDVARDRASTYEW